MAVFYASLFFAGVIAMPGLIPWAGPLPTPMGLMATAGMSPRPTEAPRLNLNKLPQELRRRQTNVQYPPPENWCGFVNSLYDEPLSCSVGLTCVNSGAALGCCSATTGICTALYTTCSNYLDTCDTRCQQDPAIRKCDAAIPFCGTYAFYGGTHLYNCQTTAMLAANVEFLNDFYITAIGSTLAPATSDVFPFTASASLPVSSSAFSLPTADSSFTFSLPSVPTFPSSSSNSRSSSYSGSLSQVARHGIIAGGTIGAAIILALIAFCLLRTCTCKRKKFWTSQPPVMVPAPYPPMQEQQQMAPPMNKAFDDYQSVPQQDQQTQQYAPYPSPPPNPAQSTYFPPPASAVSQPTTGRDPHLSTVDGSLLSPASNTPSDYIPLSSPTVTEVDATRGNPGVLPTSATAHGAPTEIDGTMGNPGVVPGGHGIPVQGQPGGSPSATEVDGASATHAANLTTPWVEGPYEMPSERH